ncbi:MAG: DeoR/GlpR family DNA-binding transcription regulator [Cyclobacteriaceae bacterium]
MNITQRHHLILEKLKENGQVSVQKLSDEMDVSEVTIRKDLKALEDRNLLFRTHGGAALENPYAGDKTVGEKEAMSVTEKSKIALAAADLVKDDDSIIIASGTSVLALARSLQPHRRLTVITSALNVAIELTQYPQIEVLQLGGILRHSSASVVGHYAEMILQDITCNLLFMGVDGIDLEIGLTTTSLPEARLNQKMIEVAQKVIVLADSSKFGRRGMAKICPLEVVDEIITNAGISEKIKSELEDKGIKITIAE